MQIELQRKNQQQFIITIDGDPWQEIHKHIFGRKFSLPDTSIPFSEWETKFRKMEYTGAFQYALRRLSKYSECSTGLQKKLEMKSVCQETIEKVITECQRLGFLNDQAWIESFIRRQLNQNKGPQSILQKLYQKGIPQNIAKEALAQFDNEEEEQRRIKDLLTTRYKKRNLSDFKERQKVIASLIRKGFSLETIISCVNAHESF